jgi:heme-degrading monooxygenase HmoA
MVLEVVMLTVKSSMEEEYEQTFKQAAPLISAIKGYCSHQLQRCLEVPGKYVLLVEWETLEDHTVGFKQSPNFQEWRQLLHHFYESPPTIEHFTEVFSYAKV